MSDAIGIIKEVPMIEVKTGDVFKDDSEALVNTVNCVGVMGRGVALQFKERFPSNFKAYKEACDQGLVSPGKMFVYDTGSMIGPRWIINFPTKRHWRGGSRMEDISSGLDDLKRVIVDNQIRTISVPPLGCGLGGLNWNMVRTLIEGRLSDLQDVRIYLHSPGYNLDARSVRATKPIEMTPGRAALVILAESYLKSAIDPVLTLLKVHKLMYFLQESGEPLKLAYAKQYYGPYAENLRHFLARTEGQLLYGFQNLGDRPYQELHVVPFAYDEACEHIGKWPDTEDRIKRVLDLVEGYESDDGIELLASVHWVCSKDHASNPKDTIRLVHAWNRRKERFTERQISTAYNRLQSQGWI